jgi:uncharacterized protein (TIGR00369 family)
MYPPVKHMLRDMQFVLAKKAGALICRAPVVEEIRNNAGFVRAGFIATLIDAYAARRAVDECFPDWVATSGLSFQMTRPMSANVVCARGRVLRTGKSTVVYEVELFEENNQGEQLGDACGIAVVTFGRLPKRDNNTTEYPKFDDGDEVRFALDNSQLDKPLIEQFGIRVLNPNTGEVEMDVTNYATNRLDALQGGAIATLADYAAELLCQHLNQSMLLSSDIELHYMALGKAGPVRTRCRLVRQLAESAVVQVEIYDAGAEDRLMSVASVRLLDW